MGQFIKLTDYKNKILSKLITNTDLVKSLAINDQNFLDNDLPEGFNATDLIYSQIYPYKFVPDVDGEAKSFITMAFGNYKYVSNEFKSGNLYFYIICHKSLIKCDYGLRYDFILDQIDQMFNKKYGVGSFKLTIETGGDLQVNENYLGATVAYRFTDFQ